MDRVTLSVAPGSVHALLGENGAGKSTLVKCVAGSQRPDGGSILVDGRERDIANPIVARTLGIGMVYQHFTLAPGMSVAENLLLAGGRAPALIDWKRERAALAGVPALDAVRARPRCPARGAGGGREAEARVLKQLYLKPRLLILDEPTSVLTPQEADEVLAWVRAVARRGECTVLMITHKFREVMAYADDGDRAAPGPQGARRERRRDHAGRAGARDDGRADRRSERGSQQRFAGRHRRAARAGRPQAPLALEVEASEHDGRSRNTSRCAALSLRLRAGEILGIAGVSGNGQRELVEASASGREPVARCASAAFTTTRPARREPRTASCAPSPRSRCAARASPR